MLNTNEDILCASENLSQIRYNLFVDDTCLYATECKEGYVLKKIQRVLNSMSAWCERWNNKINEDKTQAIYFSHQRRLPLFLH
jgi:hypothetical protein